MCGLYGYIGKPNKKTTTALRLLAIANEVRGQDSAGIVVASKGGIELYKKAVNATKFMAKETTRQIFNRQRYNDYIVAIGHSRAATTGIISDENAHPYQVGGYVFAHNGIIDNFDELQTKYKTNYQVDSQIIGYLLNTCKDKTVFEKKLQGWFTVPYFRLDDIYTLRIAKNNAPCSFCFLPDNRGVLFSSVKEHLEIAVKRAKLNGNIIETEGTKIYTLTWKNNKIEYTRENITPKSYSYGYNYGWYDDYYNQDNWIKQGDIWKLKNEAQVIDDDMPTEGSELPEPTEQTKQEDLSINFTEAEKKTDWFRRWFDENGNVKTEKIEKIKSRHKWFKI